MAPQLRVLAYCSCRGRGFGSQNSLGGSQRSLTRVLADLTLVPPQTGAYTHTQVHIHIKLYGKQIFQNPVPDRG